MDEPVKTESLRVAAAIVGGGSRLAKALGVPASSMDAWLAGYEPPPERVFLRAVDVILDHIEGEDATPAVAAAPRGLRN